MIKPKKQEFEIASQNFSETAKNHVTRKQRHQKSLDQYEIEKQAKLNKPGPCKFYFGPIDEQTDTCFICEQKLQLILKGKSAKAPEMYRFNCDHCHLFICFRCGKEVLSNMSRFNQLKYNPNNGYRLKQEYPKMISRLKRASKLAVSRKANSKNLRRAYSTDDIASTKTKRANSTNLRRSYSTNHIASTKMKRAKNQEVRLTNMPKHKRIAGTRTEISANVASPYEQQAAATNSSDTPALRPRKNPVTASSPSPSKILLNSPKEITKEDNAKKRTSATVSAPVDKNSLRPKTNNWSCYSCGR